ncbi:EAL domain-containing protein [Aliiruegeria lutimaris]|uniref:EAL domain-containing protein n=1 Tax=Aliiruegeria lutimaris TaxID=571298 RepID=A0A1G9IUP3_9RHOB|nr:EAL domain-containing protein [Aliiruegeria lutimaris]
MQARFGSDFQVSLNVSPLQLASGDASRFEAWEESLRALGQGGGLVFEITESAMLDPNPATITRLQAFRAAGVQIALDDFGAGHTSLRYYLNHDFDFLKIDREFVTGGPESARARALCESLLGFASRLDAVAIAEGVETPAQVDMLRQAGCQLGQGYFFSPPLPLEKLLELPLTLPLD